MDAWHTVGPVVVLGLAGEGPPRLGDAPIYVARAAFPVRDRARQLLRARLDHPRRQAAHAAALHVAERADRPRPRPARTGRRVPGADAPARDPPRAAADLAAPPARERATVADRLDARAERGLSRHRVPARRRGRGRRRLHRAAQPGRGHPQHRRGRATRLDEIACATRSCTALLHDIGKIRVPCRHHQQAGRAQRGRAGGHRHPHDLGRADAPAGRRPSRVGRPPRPLVPRALGRQGLPGRPRRRGDSRSSRGSSRAATPTRR